MKKTLTIKIHQNASWTESLLIGRLNNLFWVFPPRNNHSCCEDLHRELLEKKASTSRMRTARGHWSKDRGCAFSVLFLPLPTIFSLIRLLDICDSTQWYTCWYLVTMWWCTRPRDFYMHRSAQHITQKGYQIYKKRVSFTLVVDAFHVCDDDSVNEIFSTEISEICVKKNVL